MLIILNSNTDIRLGQTAGAGDCGYGFFLLPKFSGMTVPQANVDHRQSVGISIAGIRASAPFFPSSITCFPTQ